MVQGNLRRQVPRKSSSCDRIASLVQHIVNLFACCSRIIAIALEKESNRRQISLKFYFGPAERHLKAPLQATLHAQAYLSGEFFSSIGVPARKIFTVNSMWRTRPTARPLNT